MTSTVELPLWLALAGGAVCAWFLASRLLLPGVRWFFRRRINRLTATLNQRLHLKIPSIAMTKREVLIDRLVYDPRVLRELSHYAETAGIPPDVALRQVQRYAREIVPAFNAYLYFRFGNSIARAVVNMLYRVRLGHAESRALRQTAPNASVVFVMNHRSNIDYILVAYLASKRVALSYAVGEWARVWPIQQIIRSLGAYFVRRGSGNELYRRVLESYVRMAIDGGAVQAIFPEGGLTRDGLLRQPKIGLIDYMLRGFDPAGERDIVFVPVGLNYDRVLEDRTLLAENPVAAERRSGFAAVGTALRFISSQLWLRLRGRWYRFGYACANFGAPISLKAYLARAGWNPLALDRDARGQRVTEFAAELMSAVGRVIPVLPVSLVARVFVDAAGDALSEDEIRARALELQRGFEQLGAHVYVPRSDADYSVLVGLRMLTLRNLVQETAGRYRMNPAEVATVRYYANAIAHLTAPARPPNS
ncbi:MAG TPA: 1-acyl-sn-glycerol-3-phosphate acyltransferase [Steroidobacteraceae bacterium]|nr:1-acyl-sn-glycerol-3-phosphate acyltransferase [Steroidobacteraceae bacterium]